MNTETEELYVKMGISKEVCEFGEKILGKLKPRFEEIDRVAEYNQLKVVNAFQKNRIAAEHLGMSTGYGYDDAGRDALEAVYADTFHTESALVRPQITCGTHALAVALSSQLRPGDELLSPVGKPYDTLEEVIGIRESKGSLAEYGITYRQVDLLEDGEFDYPAIKAAINEKTKMVTIQRSKGYQTRKTLSVKRIGELISFIKGIKPEIICMVDNCYGEFVDVQEPTSLGADLIVGSLIKNLGGGIAPNGAYIAGKKELVELAAERLTVPGQGKETGPSLGANKSILQGIFFAPQTVANAVKTSVFASRMLEKLGYEVSPKYNEKRTDIVQLINFKDENKLIKFCQGIQLGSPIDSNTVPEPWEMPGYADKVIMAAGTFVQGSSIELSCDAPIRPPYTAFLQGGLTYEYGKAGIIKAITKIWQ